MELRILLQVLLILSAILFLKPTRSFSYSWLLIDCGSSNETSTGGIDVWLTDSEFIEKGQNIVLNPNRNFSIMNTLRYFPNDHKICYKLPLVSGGKFLFRAGLFYGNYDGLSRPPSFNLEIDGNLWATVTSSLSQEEPLYHELLYRTKEKQKIVSVCLVRTNENDVPFISSLEATIMVDSTYRLMENQTALYLQSRIDYGGNESFTVDGQSISSYRDSKNRIWKPKGMGEYPNITASRNLSGNADLKENEPPMYVMATAIQAKNVSDSIYLSATLSPQKEVVAYFVLYFMDPKFRPYRNETCKVEIYIDGKKLNATDLPQANTFQDSVYVVSLYPVRVFGSANITISPANGSTLPSMLNAMEIFHVIDVSKGGFLLSFWPELSIILLHLLAILVSY